MKKSILYITALSLLAATGCKKFVDVNQDPNNPLAVQEKILLAPIEYNIAHGIACGGEADAATYTNHFMQIVCYNQVALNYGTYYFVNTNMNQTWNTAYQICLENLKVLYPTGVDEIKDGKAVHTGGVEWTIKDGIPYHVPTLMAEIKEMVAKGRAERAGKAARK